MRYLQVTSTKKYASLHLYVLNEQGSPVEINFLWNVTVRSPIGGYQHFGGTKCLGLQGRKFLLNFGVHVPNYFVSRSGRQQSQAATTENLKFTKVSCGYFKHWPVCNELLL